MSEDSTAEPAPRPQEPAPHPQLRALDVLEGRWRLEGRDASSGETFSATVTRCWLPGGFFMTQETHVDGGEHEGTEYIGYDSKCRWSH